MERKKGSRIWIAVACLLHCALYLAFTEDLDVRELVAMVLTGAVATVAALVFATAGKVRFGLRLRDVAQAIYVPRYVIRGTGEVLHGLARQLFTRGGAPSVVAAVHFDIGPERSPQDAGRRALAISYTTATPNFIILGLVKEQKLMIFHQIIPGEVPSMTRNLGAKP